METNIGARIKQLVGNPDIHLTKQKPERHRYYKRHGRGHNHDNCDSCGDAGDILCCDTCPASFHWECVDPPLSSESIPNGSWSCPACVNQKKERNVKPPVQVKTEPGEADRMKSRNVLVKSFFDTLKSRLKQENPTQFALPYTYENYEPQFPGSVRLLASRRACRQLSGIVVEPEGTNRKRVVLLCFICSRSPRTGNLIECDFCGSYFHLDCLDPPLTSLPPGLWICPLHPEPIIESMCLKSTRISERISIWDYSSNKIVPDTVTLNFVNKAHCLIPPKRTTEIPNRKITAEIPQIVKDVYNFAKKDTEPSKLKEEQILGFQKQPFQSSVKQISEDNVEQFRTRLDILVKAVETQTTESVIDKYLKNVPPDLVRMLAAQKLAENPKLLNIFASATLHSKRQPMSSQVVETSTTEVPPRVKPPKLLPTLTFIYVNTGKRIEFVKRTIEIGSGATKDLDLSTLAPCTRMSKSHATLFYNSVRNQWELLNYSEYGTKVNGCLYGCDTSVYDNASESGPQILKDLNTLLDPIKRKLKDSYDTSRLTPDKTCSCAARAPNIMPNCWEGSAMLNEGDVIEIGCHKLILEATRYIEDYVTTI